MAPASVTRTSSIARFRSGLRGVWVRRHRSWRDCPRSGWRVGGWDTGPVSTQPQPAPKPRKNRLLQDGRDMLWSLGPLVLACLVLAGLVGMCSLPGPRAEHRFGAALRRPAALKADAQTPGIPDPVAGAAGGLAGQPGARATASRRADQPRRAAGSR